MTKKQEIEAIRELATRLGPDTYCGPWLSSVADEVEREIRSDFLPSPSIAETYARVAQAREEAKKIVETANAEAREIRVLAGKQADAIRADRFSRVRDALDRVSREVLNAKENL